MLNVGGGNKAIPIPAQFADYEHFLLDIDPCGDPDIICDARQLDLLEADQFGAIYCSHNLEHYAKHEVALVLRGFMHVLSPSGFAHIIVPDVQQVMAKVIENGLDMTDVLYTSSAGPITVHDVLYGYGPEIEASGQGFYCHKTGFTPKLLQHCLAAAGFQEIYLLKGYLDVTAIAFKGGGDADIKARFGIPNTL
jgi:hypothetical protein